MSISDPSSWAALPLPLFLLLPFSFLFFFPRKTAQPSGLDAGIEKEKLVSTPSLSEKTSQISTTRNEGMRIKELWIYPVKVSAFSVPGGPARVGGIREGENVELKLTSSFLSVCVGGRAEL